MSAHKILITGNSLPNIPWEDCPDGKNDIVWRYSGNPVITRDLLPTSNSIFNSAPTVFGDAYAGVFRVDHRDRSCKLHCGRSDDGINWEIDISSIQFKSEAGKVLPFEYGYDPRVTKIDDRYWITWCNGYKTFPTIGVGWTDDFISFYQKENAFLPFNRNGVLFPRKINGKYVMLSRPSDNAHTPFGDIFLSQSPDMTYWGEHRHIMGPLPGWQRTKVGGGPAPLETSEGWLIIYHGVLESCSGMLYAAGVALLDIDEPWKVIARGKGYILAPWMDYECVGDVPNVVFPCGMLCDADTGRIAIYYGAADTVTGLAFTTVDRLIEYAKSGRI